MRLYAVARFWPFVLTLPPSMRPPMTGRNVAASVPSAALICFDRALKFRCR